MSTVGGVISPIEDLVNAQAKSLGIDTKLTQLQYMTETTEDLMPGADVGAKTTTLGWCAMSWVVRFFRLFDPARYACVF